MKPKTFGSLLRGYRLAAGFSQELLAARAGISVESVGALERGTRRAPYRATTDALVEALRLTGNESAELYAAAASARARSGRSVTKPPLTDDLPIHLTRLIGRDEEVARLHGLVDGFRLITITGSAGVGKTRVALEVGRRVRATTSSEVWFVDLAPLSDGALIAGRIASSIRPPITDHVETEASLAAALSGRKALLILDNCEHVVAAAASAAHAIVSSCPGITILATSRERLGITSEALYRLPSLSFPTQPPSTLAEARAFGAVDLFIERAEATHPPVPLTREGMKSIVDICRRLDGIPLAIELAAAKVPTLGLAALNARLPEAMISIGGIRGVPLRQQTMQATIAWSCNLLSDHEQIVFRRLAMFSGGHTLEAAEGICADELVESESIVGHLSSLVEKSLVNIHHDGTRTRYSMLESVRAYGLTQLARAGERETLARRHAGWLAELVARTNALTGALRESTMAEIVPELDNMRSAIAWCDASALQSDVEVAARIVVGLRDVWNMLNLFVEARQTIEAVLERLDEEKHPLSSALLLNQLVYYTWQEPEGIETMRRAIALMERAGDPLQVARCHSMFAFNFSRLGRFDEAEASTERAFALALREGWQGTINLAALHTNRAYLRSAQGRFDEARADIAAATAIATALGHGYFVVLYCNGYLATIEYRAGNVERAAEIAEKMIASDHVTVQVALSAHEKLAAYRLILGDVDAAEVSVREMLACGGADETAVLYLAAIAARRGQSEIAARFMGFGDALLTKKPTLRDPLQDPIRDSLITSLRERLPEDAIVALAAEGATWTLQRVTDEARAWLCEPETMAIAEESES